MLITNAEFIQGFIRLTDDAFKKVGMNAMAAI